MAKNFDYKKCNCTADTPETCNITNDPVAKACPQCEINNIINGERSVHGWTVIVNGKLVKCNHLTPEQAAAKAAEKADKAKAAATEKTFTQAEVEDAVATALKGKKYAHSAKSAPPKSKSSGGGGGGAHFPEVKECRNTSCSTTNCRFKHPEQALQRDVSKITVAPAPAPAPAPVKTSVKVKAPAPVKASVPALVSVAETPNDIAVRNLEASRARIKILQAAKAAKEAAILAAEALEQINADLAASLILEQELLNAEEKALNDADNLPDSENESEL